ncbi:TVP38/TMEM64 family protein [Jeotgalibacillus proteolyticus]|nr:VTT domain-containing protein [Jeotgalibacillus proteolyticus]
MKQITAVGFSLAIILLVIFYKDLMLDWIYIGGSFAVIASIAFVAMLIFFPIIPYPVLAGTIGSLFGVAVGVFTSLTGIMIGTMAMFFLSRYGFRKNAQKALDKTVKLKQFELLFEKNAFLAILFARFIPIFPAPLITIVSALSKVRWSIFFIATFLGKLPAVLTLTFAGSIYEGSKWTSIGIFGLYFLILTIAAFYLFNRKIV